jgi:hypothetical protein
MKTNQPRKRAKYVMVPASTYDLLKWREGQCYSIAKELGVSASPRSHKATPIQAVCALRSAYATLQFNRGLPIST